MDVTVYVHEVFSDAAGRLCVKGRNLSDESVIVIINNTPHELFYALNERTTQKDVESVARKVDDAIAKRSYQCDRTDCQTCVARSIMGVGGSPDSLVDAVDETPEPSKFRPRSLNNAPCRRLRSPSKVVGSDVEHYWPLFGYEEHKRPFAKILLSCASDARAATKALRFLNPQHAPDDVSKRGVFNVVPEITESFMRLKHFTGCEYWTFKKCIATNQKISRCTREYVCEFSSIEKSDLPPTPRTKRMFFDIETLTKHHLGFARSHEDPVACLAAAWQSIDSSFYTKLYFWGEPVDDSPDYETVVFATETDMLLGFIRDWQTFQPDVVVTYNGDNFDIPYIIDRCIFNSIIFDVGFLVSKFNPRRFKNEEGLAQTTTEILGVTMFDMLPFARSHQDMKLAPNNELRTTMKFANVPAEKGDVPYEQIAPLWYGSSAERALLGKYCVGDVVGLKLVTEKFLAIEALASRSRVLRSTPTRLMHSGQSARVHRLLYDFRPDHLLLSKQWGTTHPLLAKHATHSDLWSDTSGYSGGYVMEPVTGLYKNVAVFDVQSLYPSTMKANNLCYSTFTQNHENALNIEVTVGAKKGTFSFVKKEVRRGVVPQMIEYLLEQRGLAKKRKEAATDDSTRTMADCDQLEFKLAANATYGVTGAAGDGQMLPLAAGITELGQRLIKGVQAAVPLNYAGVKPIYGDTDSGFFHLNAKDENEALDLCKKIGAFINDPVNKLFVEGMAMPFERLFLNFMMLNKKRYAGSYRHPKQGVIVYIKGVDCVSKKVPSFHGQTLRDIFDLMLVRETPAEVLPYVKQRLTKMMTGEVPPAELSQSVKLSKSLEEYKEFTGHVSAALGLKKSGRPVSSGDPIQFLTVVGMGSKTTRCVALQLFDPLRNMIDMEDAFESLGKMLTRILVCFDSKDVGRHLHIRRYPHFERTLIGDLKCKFGVAPGTIRNFGPSIEWDAPFIARTDTGKRRARKRDAKGNFKLDSDSD